MNRIRRHTITMSWAFGPDGHVRTRWTPARAR
jgi:hypothetical protein